MLFPIEIDPERMRGPEGFERELFDTSGIASISSVTEVGIVLGVIRCERLDACVMISRRGQSPRGGGDDPCGYGEGPSPGTAEDRFVEKVDERCGSGGREERK